MFTHKLYVVVVLIVVAVMMVACDNGDGNLSCGDRGTHVVDGMVVCNEPTGLNKAAQDAQIAAQKAADAAKAAADAAVKQNNTNPDATTKALGQAITGATQGMKLMKDMGCPSGEGYLNEQTRQFTCKP